MTLLDTFSSGSILTVCHTELTIAYPYELSQMHQPV